MNTTDEITKDEITVRLAKLALLVILAAVIVGVFLVVPGTCNEIKRLERNADVVEELRLNLTEFVNSRVGRLALVQMPGLTERVTQLPPSFEPVIANLELDRAHLYLVTQVGRSDSLAIEPNGITAIGVGYSRARLMFPVASNGESLGRFDPIELGETPSVVCLQD